MKVLSVVFCGFCFGVWPVVFKASGKSDITGMFVMMSVALSIVGGCMQYQGVSWPSGKALLHLAAAGALLGMGMARFNNLLADRSIEISIVQPAVSVLIIVFGTLCALWRFSESLPWQKTVGILLAMGAIIFLHLAPAKKSAEKPILPSVAAEIK